MGAVGKQRIKRLISQIGDIEAVHGEGSVNPSKKTVTEANSTFSPDGDDGTVFYMNTDDSAPANKSISFPLYYDGAGNGYYYGGAGVTPYSNAVISDTTDDFRPNFFSVMVKVDITGRNNPGWTRAIIISRGTHPLSGVWETFWRIEHNHVSGKFEFIALINNSGTVAKQTLVSTQAFAGNSTNGFVLVTATYDGSKMRLYINDNAASTLDAPGILDTTLSQTSDRLLLAAGVRGTASTEYPLYGKVDYVAFWNTAITSTNIANISNPGGSPDDVPTNLVSHWPCDDASGTTVTDTKNGKNMTLVGPANGAGDPTWASGDYKYVKLANPVNLVAGQTYKWIITSGADTQISYDSNTMFIYESGVTGQITLAAATDVITGTVSDDGTKIYCTMENNYT